ncbi:uncharacterized protein [Nicotiana tomentosiformis]|uniref:uncharacterized protein n=1 Tax=Nicotiana tomentosiformis TaxID=4098 RepID=UPI00388CC2BE
MTTPYAEACEILDEMPDTSSAWQSRVNVPQGDSNVIHLHKELHDHGQAIAELTTTMNQLAKAQLQKVQGPKQVNAMEGVKMMVNRRRPKGPQVQNRAEHYMQEDIRFDQDESYNDQEEEALEKMPWYTKFMKVLVTNKRSMNCETIKMTHQVSAIVHSMAPKLEYPDAFTIPSTIGIANFAKALCDLGESINLMPYSVFKTLGIGKPRPTSMILQMADRTMKRPFGIMDDVLVRVDKFILPADFVILDYEVDYKVSIIMGRPFLATGKALVDVEVSELTFWVGDEKVVFHVCKSMRQPNSNEVCSFVDLVSDVIIDDTSATMNIDDTLEAILLNLDDGEMDGYMKCVNSLQEMGSYAYGPRKLSLDLENRKTPPA